jgi:prophage antirepressor-like protein
MENKELNVFSFGGKDVRTIEIEGLPYFVGKDVAEVLGYTNPSEAIIDHVDDEDKLNSKTLSSLGQRGGWLINESGLYSLILSSKLPQAKDFKRWVTSVVLPAIRHTGGFSVGTSLPMLADLSENELVQIVTNWKMQKKFPSLTPQQIDGCLRLIPLYPRIKYTEIARAVCLSCAMITLIKDYMQKLGV